MSQRTVLVINSGSSSLKYQLLDPDTGESLASGLVERIGETTGAFRHSHAGETLTAQTPVPDHAGALALVIRTCHEVGPDLGESGIVAVGHRVVQGGDSYDSAVIVDELVEKRIAELIPLGPLHNPANLTGIQVGRELLPDVPHVAVFDTAFFQGLPARSALYALDREVAQKYAIRRYGAHGTSHQYVSRSASEFLGRGELKQIVLHMGNGASASAVVAGHAVDTSMGLTPLEGLVMGTRTGDIDPAAVFHLARVGGFSIDEIDTIFNKKSGLKGLAGDNDMRGVRTRANNGDVQAREALDVYVHRLKKYVGSYAAVMGGLDALTFTAGIGENDAAIRAEVCEGLEFLGIRIDSERNAVRNGEPRLISRDDSPVAVLVIPTNEELEIARQCVALLP